jgi:hypothetical protein
MRFHHNLQGLKSIVSKIDRFIRRHKMISIGLCVALSIVIAFAVKSTYLVPICRNQPSIKIVNESVRESFRKRIPAEATAENVHFKQYVTTIAKLFLHKIDNISQCKQAINGSPQVEIVFVYRPLVSDGIEPFDFERNKTDPTKQLNSPWVKITINKSPNPFIRAAFIWSERQYMLDQALLSGMSDSATKSPMPLEYNTFMQYGRDYQNILYPATRSPASEAIARVKLSKLLPADILWLLDHALMTDIASDDESSIRVTEVKINRIGQRGYIDLTETLIEKFFASSKTEIRYESIHDLKDIININKYRFTQPVF